MSEGKNKILGFIENNFNILIIAVFIFSLIIRLKYLTINSAVWYDEAEYLSAAKDWAFGIPYDFNFVRPALLPFIWTIFYKLGAGEFFLRIILLLFSLASLILTYLIGKILFNKYVGLIALTITSFHYLNLFYTARLLTDIPSFTLLLFTVYFFLEVYINKKDNYIYLMGLTFVLSILMRFPAGTLGGVLLLYLLLTEGFKFLKNKKLWASIGIFFIIFMLYSIWYYINYNKIPIFEASAFYTPAILLKQSLGFMPTTLMSPGYIFIILLLIGLGTILFNIILGYDLLKKDKELKKQLFVFLWVLVIFSYFAFYAGLVEDRYFFYIYSALFIIIGWVLLKLNDFLKKYHKFLGIIVIILILCTTGYQQLIYADNLIKIKADSYIQFKYAGEYIKQNSNSKDKVIAAGIPQLTYYSEREIIYWPDRDKFKELIKDKSIKYLVLSALESTPEWTYKWPEENKNKVKVVQAYFFDQEKTKPAIIIYQLNH